MRSDARKRAMPTPAADDGAVLRRLTIERDHWRTVAEQRGVDRDEAHQQIVRLLERTVRADEDGLRAARATALREAAGECHKEARWQAEQERRYGVVHQYAQGRVSLVEQILRDRADRIEAGDA